MNSHPFFRFRYSPVPLCGQFGINPFTAPACKIFGLKDARTRLQTVYFQSITHLFSLLWILMKIVFACQCKKHTQKNKKAEGFQNFALLLFVFKWHHGSEGVKKKEKKSHQRDSLGLVTSSLSPPPSWDFGPRRVCLFGGNCLALNKFSERTDQSIRHSKSDLAFLSLSSSWNESRVHFSGNCIPVTHVSLYR